MVLKPVLLMLLSATLASCGGKSAAVEEAEAASVPLKYTYILKSTCGEQALIGTYEVEVKNQRVESIRTIRGNSDVGPEIVPTLEDIIELATESGNDINDLSVDERGIPTKLIVDPDTDVDDDETCYAVEDLEER